jgi:plastocyanin
MNRGGRKMNAKLNHFLEMVQMINRVRLTPLFVSAVVALAACGGGEKASEQTPAATPPASAPSAGGPLTPGPGGKVITIEMTTDAQGVNKFVPNNLEAHQGDVLRFTLGTGVHNVSFPADSNPPGATLPGPSQLLQLPGQTHDVAVSFPPGKYYFQCDPHALLGMTGRLEVEESERK